MHAERFKVRHMGREKGGGLTRNHRGLFLDRDGVINADRGFVFRRDDFVFVDGIFDLLRVALERRLVPVVVSNQSGIARGYFTEDDLREITDWMCGELEARGVGLAGVYYCPYHPEARVERYRAAHPWRKPSPGMLLAAAEDLGIDLQDSVLVGDQWTDISAARAAGIPRTVLVARPSGPKPKGLAPTISVTALAEASRWLEATFPARVREFDLRMERRAAVRLC